MERSKQRAYDYALVIVLGIIIVTGLVILYSTSAYNGKLKFQDSFYYLKKQIFATLLGIAGMWIIARVDYHVWKKWSVPGYLVSVLLGIAVLLIGDEYNGSKRWLSLGPFSFQPSEFAKVAVILFLTYVIMRNVKSMGKFTTVCKIVVSVLPVVGLVGASNLSTAIIILGIAVVLVFVASPKYGQFAWMIFLGCAFMGIFLAMESIVWNVCRYGGIRKIMKRVIRHCKVCMQLVREDCLEKDLEAVFRNWDLCRKPRMI